MRSKLSDVAIATTNLKCMVAGYWFEGYLGFGLRIYACISVGSDSFKSFLVIWTRVCGQHSTPSHLLSLFKCSLLTFVC